MTTQPNRLWATFAERREECGHIKKVVVAISGKIRDWILLPERRKKGGDIQEVQTPIVGQIRRTSRSTRIWDAVFIFVRSGWIHDFVHR